MTSPDARALYEALAHWQWRRRSRRAPAGEGLELRKRLRPTSGDDGPIDGAAGLDRWFVAQLGGGACDRVLDLGCGFGASLVRWARAGARRCVGVGNSPFQIECARGVAASLGLAATCTFVCEDFVAAPDGPFDVVLAIESLGHAASLPSVLRRVHEVLQPGGRFFWLDDLRRDSTPSSDRDVQALAGHWRSPPLRSVGEVRDAIAQAGLLVDREVDLTARVPLASAASLRWRTTWLKLVRPLLPLARQRLVVEAFLGGVHLERLHARGAVQYRAWLASRPAAGQVPTLGKEKR